MINIQKKQNCCGCSACYSICSQGCISMVNDNEGFIYPQIDKGKCIDCGLCNTVCPFEKPYESKSTDIIYACKNKDNNIRLESSSGGIFSLISEYIFDQQGVVFGAGFDENFKVKHIYIEDKEALTRLRGSKYVQSEIGDAYKQCKDFLRQGRLVVFSGTPCQIAGLKHYLQNEYDNLTCVDIVCHGVPSPMVWGKYIKELESKIHAKITKLSFKDKTTGWHDYSFMCIFENNIIITELARDNVYMKGFLSELFTRPACHDCKAKNFTSGSDITLADYWGIEEIMPEFYDDRGISVVCCNTKKGERVISAINEYMHVKPAELSHVIQHNPCLVSSICQHRFREKFFKRIDKAQFNRLIRIFLKPTLIKKSSNLLHKAASSIKKSARKKFEVRF